MNRSSPLGRRVALKRSWIRRKRRSTRYSRRPRDIDRMRWTRHQPCALRDARLTTGSAWLHPNPPDACAGHVQAHHAGKHGLSQKADDNTVIPLCNHHHDDLTNRRGVFAGWPPYMLKAWEVVVITHYQHEYENRGP